MKTPENQLFAAYLNDPAEVPKGLDAGAILRMYPWFTTVRLLHEAESGDPLAALSRLTRPVSGGRLETPSAADFAKRTDTEIIDTFLLRGEYRIVPQDDTPDADADGSADGGDDAIVSEELAEIYRNQGLAQEAKAIYSKLSLLYPEKSVYFAEIIGKIDLETK